MSEITVGAKFLEISLTARERSLMGRPNFSIELSRITSFELTELPREANLGVRASRRPLFGGLTGQWRRGSSKVLVLGGKSGAKALKISLLHPTIDEIWYCGNNIKKVLHCSWVAGNRPQLLD